MIERQGPSGPKAPSFTQSPVVPAILDGDTADVALTANSDFIGATAVMCDLAAAPLANLGIVSAWISNSVTGVVTVRFSALTGNVAGGAQAVFVQKLAP